LFSACQRINSPADGVSILKYFVKTLTIILPKSFIFAAKFSRQVEWGLYNRLHYKNETPIPPRIVKESTVDNEPPT